MYLTMNTKSPTARSYNRLQFARNVVAKALILFLIIDLLFGLTNPLPALGRISLYNHLLPGRLRLPYGDEPQRSYNLSLFQLDAMFASIELASGSKPGDEFRVIIIGDSATWGFLLPPDQTLAAFINAGNYTLRDGRRVRAYNLGYPVMSLAKDLLILSYAIHYHPDMIVWPFTLESFPYDKQLYPPLLQHNSSAIDRLIREYQLPLNAKDAQLLQPTFWDRTLVGSRRDLADMVRLQLYGVMWAATGIDQYIPQTYTPRMEDLPADLSFHNLNPPQLQATDLALPILQAGLKMCGSTPVLLFNEPMFISQGINSDLRYNFYYPRWAYDDFRQIMHEQSQRSGWTYEDDWNVVPASEFTNSAVHMTPKGEAEFARLVAQKILAVANQP
jgi:hypothetical protein